MEDEELEEILGRLDIPIEAQADRETLKEYLEDILQPTTTRQLAAFPDVVDRIWEGIGTTATMENLGIRRLYLVYETGPRAGQSEVRYAITGVPGLWSYEVMRQFLEAERGLW